MKICVQSVDYKLWRIIMNGSRIPMKRLDAGEVAKLEDEWDENNIKQAELNAKVMNLLCCALDPSEFNRISNCTSAKEIWDTLELPMRAHIK